MSSNIPSDAKPPASCRHEQQMPADYPKSKASAVSFSKPDHVKAMAKLNQLKLQSCKSSSDIPQQPQPVHSGQKREKAISHSRKPYPNATLNSHRDNKE